MTYPTKATFENELSKKITIQIRNVMGYDEALDHCVEIDIERTDPVDSDEWTITPVEAFVLLELLAEHFDYDIRRAEVKPY